MKNKFLKTALLSCVLALNSNVNATIIDYGDYTTDTVTGLDWLDWDTTDNLAGTEALAKNEGWRYATALEAMALFDVFGFEQSYGSSGKVDESYQVSFERFNDLFGTTHGRQSSARSYAQVYDGGLFGLRDDNNGTYWVGKGQKPNQYNADARVISAGIALVRSSVAVPEPSTLAVLALGVLSLGFRRFKKHS